MPLSGFSIAWPRLSRPTSGPETGESETTKGAYLQNEQHCALMDVLGHPNAFLALLNYVELCRLAAPPTLNVTPDTLIQFVAG